MRLIRNAEGVNSNSEEAGGAGVSYRSSHMRFKALSLLTASIGLVTAPLAHSQFVINTSPGLFTPSFRDGSNADLGNTTYWGWTSGSYDQSLDNELVDAPPVTLGTGGLNGSLNQVGSNDILSGSNNIYTGGFANEVLTLGIPTNGTPSAGFTSIIVQGRTAFGGFNVTPGLFSSIAGVAPTLVFGNNAAGQGQFWAKYEVPGNAASYSVDWSMPELTSVAGLTVDTQWSPTGFATDTAAVPEPSVWILVVLGASFTVFFRRSIRSLVAQ